MEIVLKTSKHQKELEIEVEDDYDEELLKEQVAQLGIKLQTGKDEESDKRQIFKLLNRIFAYPSTEFAQTHRRANRLGELDVNKEERYRRISDRNMWVEQSLTQICRCCGFLVQEKGLNTCSHSLEDIGNLGISTYLYFKMIFNVSMLLVIMFFVYSIYSFATNIQASNINIDGNYSSTALQFLSISLGSKQVYASEEKKLMYVIGAWIGCGMLILWGLAFLGLRYLQKQNEVAILLEAKSVSEFSLVIENLPTGMTKAEVQREFKDYLRRIKQNEEVSIDKLQVVKFNQGQPFYFNQNEYNDEDLKQALETTKQYKQLFKSWLMERQKKAEFSKSKKFRERKYKEYNRLLERKKRIIGEITTKIKEHYQQKNEDNLTTTAFITFASNHQKNFVLDHNPNTIVSRIKNHFPCFRNQNRFYITKNDKVWNLRILPAPDPQDVVWSNLGVSLSQKITRKLLTYSITALILAISFVITYSLSTAKVSYQNNQILTVVISLSISIINIIIGQVIEVLTSYERDYTMTNYQISLTIKTVLAQIINSIFIPIVADYFIKKNIYEENGLIEDIFILGITNSILYPIAKIINPSYILKYFYAKYKLIPTNKIDVHQFQLNEMVEKQQFEVGYEYIYIVNLFIFTCFFVSLQPILPIFALIGLLLIYWIQRYTLFNRCQRPVPGTTVINTTVSQMIYFGAIAYTLGSMTWANFLPASEFSAALAPNIFALTIAIIIFVLPYESIFRKIFKKKRMPQILYSQTRIFFTSEYDRLNPSTSEIGVKQYFAFLENKVKELENEDLVYKSRLSYQLQFANRPNFYKQQSQGWLSATKYNEKHVIQNLVKKQSKNSMTPQMIASIIMKQLYSKPASLVKSRVQQSLAKLRPQKQLFRRQTEQKQIKLANVTEEEQQSKNYLPDLQRIESFNIGHLGRNSNFTYNQQQKGQQRVDHEYFNEMSQVRSYIMKADNNNEKGQKDKQPAEFSFKKQAIQKQSPVNVANEEKNITFRKYMSGEDKGQKVQIDCADEVQNRFSINENILPLCMESRKSRQSLFDSRILYCNIACFQ